MQASTDPRLDDAGSTSVAIRFGTVGEAPRFELQPRERRLLADGEPVELGARAFDLLLALVARPGTLLTKSELLDRVWPGLVVEEANLSVQVSNLRRVLGREAVATIPGRGYRFTAAMAAGPAPDRPTAEADGPRRGEPPAQRLKTNLPATLPPLLGREDDLRALHGLVDQHRLVTLVGAGGAGKTLLSQHLSLERSDRYRHGVCFADLGRVDDGAELPSAIARALGIALDGGDAGAALCLALSPLDLLLLLDNAEQIPGPVAALATAMSAAAPGVRLLITSQTPLRLGAERAHRLAPLAVPSAAVSLAEARCHGAVSLFEARARAADSRFSLKETDVATVVDIVRRLDGHALAIELAAARAPVLGLTRIAQGLDDRLQLLTRGKREAPARQQTLRGALEWSHALLGPAERVVFRRLAALPGATNLEMLQAVLADTPVTGPGSDASRIDEWTLLDALSELVDRSLVVVEAGDDDVSRYRLLESPRALASEQLEAAGERDMVRERHARAWAAWARHEAEQPTFGEATAAALLIDHAHLTAALGEAVARHDGARALDLLPSVLLRAFHVSRAEAGRWAAVLADLLATDDVPSGSVVPAARACHQAASALRHNPRDVIDWSERGSRLLAGLPADARPARLLFRLELQQVDAWALSALNDPDSGHRQGHVAHALAASRRAQAVRPASVAAPDLRAELDARAVLAACQGDFEQGLRHALEAAAVARGSRLAGGAGPLNLVNGLLMLGRFEEAFEEASAMLRERVGGRGENHLSVIRLNATTAALALDRLPQARALARESWAAALRFGHDPWWADALSLLLALEGRHADAARLAGYADAAYAAHGDERQPNEAAAVARARGLARARLGDAAVSALEVEGSALDAAAVALLVFGAGAAA